MEINSTPLYTEAMNIINRGDTGSGIGWRAVIHLGDTGKTISPLQVTAVNIRCDFVLGFADEFTCTLTIPFGQYARRVYPNRNNLEISLMKIPHREGAGENRLDINAQAERFSATLIGGDKSPTVGQGRESIDEGILDLMDILQVSFQLTNKAVEKIRMISVGGTFRNTTVKDTLLGILTKESLAIKVDNQRAIEGVDMVKPKNLTKRDHILIPQGVKLFDVCDYVQKNIGVYNAGIGSYIRGKTWHVFPLHDTTIFNESKLTLTVLILPRTKFPQLERTYKKTGNSLTLLSTSETSFVDDNGSQYLNFGNGARFADANKFMSGFNETTENTTLVSRAKNVNEFKLEDRPNNVNNINITQNKITANPFFEYSKIIARKGGVFTVMWENSDPTLLVPGMLTRVVYFDNTEMKEIYGTLLGAEHISIKIGDFGSNKHSCNSKLQFFVNQKKGNE